MIELGSSIISSTIATVLLYPAQRVKIQMQLNTVKQNKSNLQVLQQKETENLLRAETDTKNQDLELQEKVALEFSSSDIQGLIQKEINLQKKMNKFPKPTSSSQVIKKTKRTTISDSIAQIYAKNGWTGFYTGLQSLVIGNGLSYGVYFVIYQKCKTYLGFEPGSVFDTIKCSAIAGIGATLATNPFWVLQTKQTEENGSLIEKAKQLIRNQGSKALWKGLSSSLILVSNPIIQFVIYEQLKKFISNDKSSGLYDLVIFLIGAISKMISTIFTYPITVIRTKQHISVEKKKWDKILKDIIRGEGVRGLFKGIEPKLVQTVLNSALLLMLFERIRQTLLSYVAKKF